MVSQNDVCLCQVTLFTSIPPNMFYKTPSCPSLTVEIGRFVSSVRSVSSLQSRLGLPTCPKTFTSTPLLKRPVSLDACFCLLGLSCLEHQPPGTRRPSLLSFTPSLSTSRRRGLHSRRGLRYPLGQFRKFTPHRVTQVTKSD